MKKKPRKPSIRKSVSNASIHRVYIARGGRYTAPSLSNQFESLKKLSGLNLKNQRKNIISAIIQTLYGKMDPQIKKEVVHLINTHEDLRSINNDIDNFIERIETVIQDFIQTSYTTSIKVITSAVPGISIIGALLTSTINWSVWGLKIRYNYLEWKNISDDIKGKMNERMPNLKAKEESSETGDTNQLKKIFDGSLKRNMHEMKQATASLDNVKAMAKDKVAANLDNVNKKINEEATKQLKTNAIELAATAMKQGANSLS